MVIYTSFHAEFKAGVLVDSLQGDPCRLWHDWQHRGCIRVGGEIHIIKRPGPPHQKQRPHRSGENALTPESLIGQAYKTHKKSYRLSVTKQLTASLQGRRKAQWHFLSSGFCLAVFGLYGCVTLRRANIDGFAPFGMVTVTVAAGVPGVTTMVELPGSTAVVQVPDKPVLNSTTGLR